MCNLPVADLPALYSHLGGRSIVPLGIAQSWIQIAGVWEQNGAWAMWGAATAKLIGPGIDEPEFLEGLSRLIVDHDVSEPVPVSGTEESIHTPGVEFPMIPLRGGLSKGCSPSSS